MKTLKRIIPLLLAIVLTLGLLPLGAYATEDEIIPAEDPSEEIGEAMPSPEAEATTPPESLPADTDSEIPDEPSETPESPETTIEPEAAPSEETVPPVAEETTSPQPEEKVQPETEASPSPVPEDESPIIDGVSFYGQPWGEGIFFAPDDFLPSVVPFVMSASGTATIDVRGCYDSNSNIIRYASSFSYAGRVVGGYNTARHTIYANDEPAYCLEPGKLLFAGNVVTISAASVWNDLGTAKQNAIKLALLCGAEGNKSNLPGSYGSQYTATQMVIWEIVVGVRNTSEPYSCTDNKVINSVCSGGANSEVKAVYDQIVADMQSYNTLPSFANSKNAPPPQQEMAYSGGKYTLTLTDTRGVLGNYNVTSTDSNVKVSVSGNKLTLTSSVPISGATINLERKSAVSASSQITAYAAQDLQETIIGIEAVGGTPGYFSVYTSGGPTPTPTPTPTPKGACE